jgi:hypothetical protein
MMPWVIVTGLVLVLIFVFACIIALIPKDPE